MRLPLGAVNLFGMHIIPPLTINAGTHCTYPQRDGGYVVLYYSPNRTSCWL